MNASTIKPTPVFLQLDRPRQLVFDLNAMICLEETYGSIPAAFDAVKGGSIKAVRTVLWAGLQHEHEPLTQHEVGKLITIDNLPDVSQKLTQAFTGSMPSDDEVKSLNEAVGEDLGNEQQG